MVEKSFSNRKIASWISTSVFCHFMRMLHDVFTAFSTTLLKHFCVIFLDTAPRERDKKKYRIPRKLRIQAIQVPCGRSLSQLVFCHFQLLLNSPELLCGLCAVEKKEHNHTAFSQDLHHVPGQLVDVSLTTTFCVFAKQG